MGADSAGGPIAQELPQKPASSRNRSKMHGYLDSIRRGQFVRRRRYEAADDLLCLGISITERLGDVIP